MTTSKQYLMYALIICKLIYDVDSNCTNPSDCNNKGHCNRNLNKCLCRIGWEGENCSANSRFGSATSYPFTSYNLENGGIIPCTVGEKCSFPIFLKSQTSGISTGPVSGDINVVIGLPEEDEQNGTITTVTVETSTAGIKVVCLYHGTSNSVCYQINATSIRRSTDFIYPTYPDGTTIPCSRNMCHLYLYTEKRPKDKCGDYLYQPPLGTAIASIFNAKQDIRNLSCVTEMSILPSDGDLCITYIINGVENSWPLCYTITDRTRISDPCSSETCSGHGSCLAKNENVECICASTYLGTKCGMFATAATTETTTVQKGDMTPVIVAISVSVPLGIGAIVAGAIGIKKYLKNRALRIQSDEDPAVKKYSSDADNWREMGDNTKLKGTERKIGKKNNVNPDM